MNKGYFIFSIILFLCGCDVFNKEDAIVFSQNFINNEREIYKAKSSLNSSIKIYNKVVNFNTLKPGSHIITSNCYVCYDLSDNSKNFISDFINDNKLSGIKVMKDSYIEFSFLHFRNSKLNDYYLREYINIEDTLLFEDATIEKYYIMDNWILYSDTIFKW